jgi:hypothetical protein
MKKNLRKATVTSTASVGGGIGFGGLLTILFIGLKLTNFIAWSWFWVLSPVLIPVIIGLGLLATGGILLGIGYLIERK